ncbi:phenylalanine--tRNA ligase subunit alpha [Candidatus Roizmanbacteria bacterium RIFCSPLOWO2_02_FULL_37_19]|uniref:Phenylalanine--tRNA ligase alpha subunit n=1 Tax=Candidatus Roizmanbacteria bacterium RIFCSPHIGHO2_02_FULL_37_24 TaxID=1802037 RepID=A0A1F7GUX2_9BACT|nr:MAG: phenylalanine--tRNA ligase subunit alpha [Candidatus Roizmanbacteria bacterium RIFCSPHIGHO2_01_FULL_38_41]OGK22907.1 MAG: phenylalanine--tRNA ligase subunit alpha [Candidatus Roizmanbacteria bacterium RIFCSPHIGHO2_02_FULL_37_24]OGK33639.1 MAG: phenylalanine--tRNA ligase subunit alpha [Candidatus Roizmanbacteria bacterium RIFCSPHIGHO2_12_FULL_37_23]OGK44987.1 MAG: phenylalanine--tRNA ligase subunit alpha [Candidatus Roizmanbacteria bacterium RIFCSPLOWO2_01_FULL_37_57]OGK55291.1 MAG: phen
MNSDIAHVKQNFEKDLKKITSIEELNLLNIAYLGRKGRVNEVLLSIKDVPKEKRKIFGESVNTLKFFIQKSIDLKRGIILQKKDREHYIDPTLPGLPYPHGSLHIVTYAIEEISQIFERLGFIRMSYREVEWEYFSFESLNMPKDHPARDDFETFFIDFPPHKEYGKMVLTPHTSSGQVREMIRSKKPPIKMINIAKTYRPNWDATHVPMFHQFEGLCIDSGINITNLKGTIEYFARSFFGNNREIRLRPFHFQFTEPSFEVDVTCDICQGTGKVKNLKCKVCKSGWLELGGAGMVHPNVLREGRIDPKKYSGWAFGFGIERVFMMKQGLNVDDIRILYSGDIRFLEQF